MAQGYLTPRRSNWLAGRPQGGGSIFDLHRQVNRLFDSLIEPSDQGGGMLGFGSGGSSWPQLEIDQDERQITVHADLPGVKEDDIDLTVEDGVLTLSGEKRSERKDDQGYSERSYGRFERRISLPSNIDEDACNAQFKDGVLTVTIPRCAEKQRGRRIPLGGQAQDRQQAPGGGNDNAAEASRQQAAEQGSTTQHSGSQSPNQSDQQG